MYEKSRKRKKPIPKCQPAPFDEKTSYFSPSTYTYEFANCMPIYSYSRRFASQAKHIVCCSFSPIHSINSNEKGKRTSWTRDTCDAFDFLVNSNTFRLNFFSGCDLSNVRNMTPIGWIFFEFMKSYITND